MLYHPNDVIPIPVFLATSEDMSRHHRCSQECADQGADPFLIVSGDRADHNNNTGHYEETGHQQGRSKYVIGGNVVTFRTMPFYYFIIIVENNVT